MHINEHCNVAPCPPVHEQSEYEYCPENYPHECTRSCYRIDGAVIHGDNQNTYTWRKSYHEAKLECDKLKGHLASIRTEQDQKCLEKYIEHYAYPMYIGLYKTVTEGRHVWQWEQSNVGYDEGSSYLNWAPSEFYTLSASLRSQRNLNYRSARK